MHMNTYAFVHIAHAHICAREKKGFAKYETNDQLVLTIYNSVALSNEWTLRANVIKAWKFHVKLDIYEYLCVCLRECVCVREFSGMKLLCDVSNTGYLSSDTYWAVRYHLSFSFYQLPLSLSHTCSVSYNFVFFCAVWFSGSTSLSTYKLSVHADYVHDSKLEISVHMIFYMFDFGEPICSGCNVDLCSYGSALLCFAFTKIDSERGRERDRENYISQENKKERRVREDASHIGSPNSDADTKIHMKI